VPLTLDVPIREETRAATPAADDFAAVLVPLLIDRIGASRYDLWLKDRSVFHLTDDGLTVGVPNLHFQNWIEKLLGDAIRQTAADMLDRPVPVRFRIEPQLFQALRAEQQHAATTGKPKPELTPLVGKPHLDKAPPKSEIRNPKSEIPKRRWHHLHEFVVGPCNRVAYAAALSVVEQPGQGSNPLVLHGPVGTGKTHLLEGIYAGLRRRNPERRVIYIAAEDFTNRFIAAVRFGKQTAFRKHFRSGDVFLLDDLHFLAKKRATQEEFLHTFDALMTEGKQVVLSCDCHPRLNDDFVPELMDRLLGGAIWGLQPPDAESRLSLLRAKAARGSAPMADEVLAFLAERLRGNVRELEGALNSLRHFSLVTSRAIDCDLAHEALGDLLRHAVRVVRLVDVEAAVRELLQLPTGSLQSKDRTWAVSHPRMLAMFLGRKHTAASFSEISKFFGGKSHSAAVAAEKKVRQWLQADEKFVAGSREWSMRELIERIERVMAK
jgi:chromosomal replication initiator protein